MSAKPLVSFQEIAAGHPFFLDPDFHPDWPGIFQNNNPLKLEIGFGNGGFLIEMAIREPEMNFIGIDMFHKGIRKLITRAEKLLLKNIRMVYGDAREKTPIIFRDGELREVFINFPDPWPKKRHAKRRLIKPAFVDMLASRLEIGGEVHLATDYTPYAQEMLVHLEAESRLHNKSGPLNFLPSREAGLPKSKYEKNFIGAGEKIFYLSYVRK